MKLQDLMEAKSQFHVTQSNLKKAFKTLRFYTSHYAAEGRYVVFKAGELIGTLRNDGTRRDMYKGPPVTGRLTEQQLRTYVEDVLSKTFQSVGAGKWQDDTNFVSYAVQDASDMILPGEEVPERQRDRVIFLVKFLIRAASHPATTSKVIADREKREKTRLAYFSTELISKCRHIVVGIESYTPSRSIETDAKHMIYGINKEYAETFEKFAHWMAQTALFDIKDQRGEPGGIQPHEADYIEDALKQHRDVLQPLLNQVISTNKHVIETRNMRRVQKSYRAGQ